LRDPAPTWLADGLRAAVAPSAGCRYHLPLLVLPGEVPPAPEPTAEARIDPVETLFVRINAGGTPLAGEELNYSVLKSIFPNAEDLVAAAGMRLTSPSRTLALFTRLLLARGSAEPPAAVDVPRFRRLIHGGAEPKDFRQRLLDELENGSARSLFADAREILMQSEDASTNAHRLVAAQAADIGDKTPEALFLLLVWLDRLRQTGRSVAAIDPVARRRLLGIVTAVAWFAVDRNRCLRALWPLFTDPLAMLDVKPLAKCLRRSRETGAPGPLLVLFPPQFVEEAVLEALTGYGTKSDGNFYGLNYYDWWYDRVVKVANKPKLASWARGRAKLRDDDAEEDGSDAAEAVWREFINRLWDLRPLVLYAQRRWLHRWFPHFDPTAVHRIEDTDRPWDFDHIHPQKYVTWVVSHRVV